ncbi:hypothetical protein [Pararobbsia silviterrae]|uniref:hypothetical protein n=1 Tax=Pararobbsia silviterrae TaxID=1792498 RepID=UPI0011C38D35|nr:hypothetical protein [Pararobbsia silviterrae]
MIISQETLLDLVSAVRQVGPLVLTMHDPFQGRFHGGGRGMHARAVRVPEKNVTYLNHHDGRLRARRFDAGRGLRAIDLPEAATARRFGSATSFCQPFKILPLRRVVRRADAGSASRHHSQFNRQNRNIE